MNPLGQMTEWGSSFFGTNKLAVQFLHNLIKALLTQNNICDKI